MVQGTKLWIIMEYLGGGSALELMKPGPFSEQFIAVILGEILKGLDYLHSEKKLHRDIKGRLLPLSPSLGLNHPRSYPRPNLRPYPHDGAPSYPDPNLPATLLPTSDPTSDPTPTLLQPYPRPYPHPTTTRPYPRPHPLLYPTPTLDPTLADAAHRCLCWWEVNLPHQNSQSKALYLCFVE